MIANTYNSLDSHRSVEHENRLSSLRAMNSFQSTNSLAIESGLFISQQTQNITLQTGQKTTPLPIRTIFILCVVILCEPLSMTILFPFVYFMVRDFGIGDEKEIGYYCGFIASAFSVAQFITSMFWGYLSDKFGRRPILLFGLLGNAFATLTFGVSKSLAHAIISRGLCGFLNGNVGIAKSVLGEITDSTNSAKAFSYFGLTWGVGMILGPILGGFLSNPVDKFPYIFGSNAFLLENPYFLPCAVSASVSMMGFIVGVYFLNETSTIILAKRARNRKDVVDEETPLLGDDVIRNSVRTVNEEPVNNSGGVCVVIEDDDGNTTSERVEERSLNENSEEEFRLKNGRINLPSILVISGYGCLSFFNIIFDEVFSLWMVTPVIDGGLAYQARDIGSCLSIMGIVTLVSQLLIFPFLSRFKTPLSIYRFSIPSYAIIFLIFPLISKFIAGNEDKKHLTWTFLVLTMTWRHLCNVHAFTSVMIMTSNSAHRYQLGFVNGVGQTTAAFVRSIGPALGGIMWSWSLTNGNGFPFNSWFVFLLLSALAVGTCLQSFFIPGCVARVRDGGSAQHQLEL